MARVDPVRHLVGRYGDQHRDNCDRHFIYSTLAPQIKWSMFHELPAGGAGRQTLWAVVDMSGDRAVELTNVQGTLHGGAIATIFDGVCGILFTISGSVGFTASLTTNYKAPIPLPSVVLCKAEVVRIEGRKVWMDCTLANGFGGGGGAVDGQLEGTEVPYKVFAEGTSLFLTHKA
jgi:acyl-coenzyme A thioesterase PaaI-like protein